MKRKPSKTSRKPAKRKTVSLSVVAGELNLGKRRIQQLAREGLPRTGRGKYDLRECFRFYIRYLQRKIAERAIGTDGEATAGATRYMLLSIESELKQLQLTEKREQLVSRDRVDKDMKAIVRAIRCQILALSPRIAAEVLGETDLAIGQVKIDRSLKGALEVLSDFDPDDDAELTSSSRG